MTNFSDSCYEPFDYITVDFFTCSKTISFDGRLCYIEVVNYYYYIMVETTKTVTHLITLVCNAQQQ
jgi:dolichyl-phosphate-mannose--protein O-mannosyl transferase